MRRITLLAAEFLLLLCSTATGQIVVPPEVSVAKLGIAKLDTTLPEGTYLADGGWEIIGETSKQVPDAEVFDNTLVFTGTSGKYIVIFDAVLLQDITFKDGDGNTVTIPAYKGKIKDRANCEIVGGSEPDPGPDPQPGPVGPYQIAMFYEADQLDNYPAAQRALLTSLKYRQDLVKEGHVFLEVFEAAAIQGSSPRYKAFFDAVRGDALPRIAFAPKAGGKVVDYPLPENWEALQKLLKETE